MILVCLSDCCYTQVYVLVLAKMEPIVENGWNDDLTTCVYPNLGEGTYDITEADNVSVPLHHGSFHVFIKVFFFLNHVCTTCTMPV